MNLPGVQIKKGCWSYLRNGSGQRAEEKILAKCGQDQSLEIDFGFLSSPQDGVMHMANYKNAFFSKIYLVKVY